MKKVLTVLLTLCLTVLIALPVLADQAADCPEGGFSLTLPDDFAPLQDPPEEEELRLAWGNRRITLLGYVSPVGKNASSRDLFAVLTGNETEQGSLAVGNLEMLYALDADDLGPYMLYTWIGDEVSVTLYFYYTGSDTPDQIRAIMETCVPIVP